MDETIEKAVIREVMEETGVISEVRGVLGIRNRYSADNGNSIYVIFLMLPISGEPKPDQREVDQANYFSLEEILQLPQIPDINKEVANCALSLSPKLLNPHIVSQTNGPEYTLFLG